jgi:4-diphosphocytidyl-2-C-methyl-D-erythritol kinase
VTAVTIVREFAPAKVNLFLHVGPPGADGYHPIASLMTFADIGDDLTLRPASAMGFFVGGPFSAALAGETDNLVTQARDAILAASARAAAPFHLTLEKILPIASGLGGGSSDAAAALRLVRAALGLALDDGTLAKIAAGLGADTPACLAGRTAIATGRGDVLRPAPPMPPLDAVLVNPMVASPTAGVYRAYDLAPSPAGADLPRLPSAFGAPGDVAAFLSACRNDLEAPAVNLRPEVGAVLASLRGQPESLLARMSGSGATCFSLCRDAAAAAGLEARLQDLEPGWWVRRCRLGDRTVS